MKSDKKHHSLPLGVPYVFLIGSFFLLDLWLRFATKEIGRYPIFTPIPCLFSFCWACILASVVLLIPSRRLGRVCYGLFYYLSAVYTMVQFGYYQLFGKFLYFSDFRYIGEGSDYASYVTGAITPKLVIPALLFLVLGILGIFLIPRHPVRRSWQLFRLGTALAGILGVLLTPKLYGPYSAADWDSYSTPAFEYDAFVNSTYDMELMGVYQYICKNTKLSLEQAGILGGKEREAMRQEVDDFFAQETAHTDNSMTGLFAGKNVIVVMMESLDDWLITPEDTPTIYRLQQEGINFTQMYTPEYASGYTFNTEFAFNTGVYPYTNSNAAYGLASNSFSESIANLFQDAGYATNSYHRSSDYFYNRKIMHTAFGYLKYHGYYGYVGPEISRENDAFVVQCDQLYEDMTAGEPFMSFIITYSPHLPYDLSDDTTQEAIALHPEYAEDGVTEVSALKAKVRLTDDMFDQLLTRLEEDGLLEDTVIVAFTDHYAYGLSDQDYLQAVSEAAGNSILENTPLFIYCAGYDSMTVEKVMQTTDLTPTIANLFGLEYPAHVMGHDVFDENYAGYVIFPNTTWLTAEAYMKEGVLQWNNGMTDQEVEAMTAFVQRVYTINNDILDSDYYRYLKE